MQRGDIWWANLPPPAGRRPVALVSRDHAIRVRDAVTVAQVTTAIREIPTEVLLGVRDGLPKSCVINCDVLSTVSKKLLTDRITHLTPMKIDQMDEALLFALGLD